MAIRGLLFDFDGLLVDTETPSRLVWEELYREHGHELPREQWATLVGTIGARSIRSAISRSSSEAARQRGARPRAGARASTSSPISRSSVPGRGVLRRRGAARAVHRGREQQRRRVDRAPPRPPRPPRRAGHDRGRKRRLRTRKAAARISTSKRSTVSARADEAIAFEDSPNGVTAAKAAGLVCVAVPNPITATLALDDADLVLESLADVPLAELLERF